MGVRRVCGRVGGCVGATRWLQHQVSVSAWLVAAQCDGGRNRACNTRSRFTSCATIGTAFRNRTVSSPTARIGLIAAAGATSARVKPRAAAARASCAAATTAATTVVVLTAALRVGQKQHAPARRSIMRRPRGRAASVRQFIHQAGVLGTVRALPVRRSNRQLCRRDANAMPLPITTARGAEATAAAAAKAPVTTATMAATASAFAGVGRGGASQRAVAQWACSR